MPIIPVSFDGVVLLYNHSKIKVDDKNMNEFIVKNFPKTEEAVLVEKWLSNTLPSMSNNSFLERIFLSTIPQWQNIFLEEALRLEKESKEKK